MEETRAPRPLTPQGPYVHINKKQTPHPFPIGEEYVLEAARVLYGQKRYTAHPDAPFVTDHWGHERPAICLRVVHFYRVQVGLAVVAAHRVQAAAVGYQRDATAPSVHGSDEVPLVRHGVVNLCDAQEGGSVVTAADEHLAAQGSCPVTAAFVQHTCHRVPRSRVVIVILHLWKGTGGKVL